MEDETSPKIGAEPAPDTTYHSDVLGKDVTYAELMDLADEEFRPKTEMDVEMFLWAFGCWPTADDKRE